MQIVLEGPDNAGKSTLAAFLSEKLAIPITHSGGPSKYPGEVNARSYGFNQDTATRIYDRHPCVSQNIYQRALKQNGELVEDAHLEQFYANKPLIIYCRSLGDLSGHQMSEHSSAEYFDEVKQNYDELRMLYDVWALDHANLVYRIGDSMEDVANACAAMWYGASDYLDSMKLLRDAGTNMWQDIADFHTKFLQDYNGKPRHLSPELSAFRTGFMGEELEEYENAVANAQRELSFNAFDAAEFLHHLELQADSLVDLTYVTMGTAYIQGFDFPEMWRRVHTANMAKVVAMREGVMAVNVTESGRDKRFDIVKPEGWMPPSHKDLLEDHAHR